MVATSLLHHHPRCPRTANQRMLHTPTFSAAAAPEGVGVMSMSGTMVPLLSVVKHPVSDRLVRAVTRQRHNRRKRQSLLVCVQEPGICSIRNIWIRRNSKLQLRLISVSGALWSKDFSATPSLVSFGSASIRHCSTITPSRFPPYFSMRALYFSNPPKKAPAI